MKDRIEALKQIVRLRLRDVQRREREAAEARAGVARAEAMEANAERACHQAVATCEKALAEQRARPADPHVRLHVRAVEVAMDRARQIRAQASEALVQARTLAEQLRHEWLRAQQRHDALAAELDRAIRALRRQIERRADDRVVVQTAALPA